MQVKILLCLLYLGYSSIVIGQEIKGLSFVGTKEKVLPEHVIPVQNVGANWVTLMPFGYLRSAADSEVRFDTRWQWEGETSTGIEAVIPLFKAAKIKVMLKPQIWISKGVYTGRINPTSQTDWEELKASYRAFILHFARLAEKHQLSLFCIGTELSSMVKKDVQFWDELIQEIRTFYKGQLTYAENWDQYQGVPFWDKLDYIGINAYFPLKGSSYFTVEDIKHRWENISPTIAETSTLFNRPVLFTEMGYRSISNPLSRPWDYNKKAAFNSAAQAMALTALLDHFTPLEWWKGGFVWKWFPDHVNAGGENHTGFSPQNKAAQKVLTTHFTKRK